MLALSGCGLLRIGENRGQKLINDVKTKIKEILSSISGDDEKDWDKRTAELISAMDKHDKEGIRKCFSEYVRKNDKNLDKEIGELLSAYSGPTDSWRWSGSSTQSYSSAPEENREYITCTAVLKSGERHFYLYLEYTTIDMSDNEREGLCCVDFRTPEVQAAFSDGKRELVSYAGKKAWENEDHYKIHVATDHKGNYETRRIAGSEMIYTPTETNFSSQDFVDFANTNSSLKDLKEKFGPGNAWQDYLETIYYKVSDGDDLYVCVTYMEGSEEQEIYQITLVSEENNFLKSLYLRD
jgi:hypothetical protein